MKDKTPMPIPTVGVMGLRVSKSGLNYKINMELVGLTLYWDGDRVLTAEATAGLFNRTSGLCGTLDQTIGNDLMSKDGKLHKVISMEFLFVHTELKFSRTCSWLRRSSIRGKCNRMR